MQRIESLYSRSAVHNDDTHYYNDAFVCLYPQCQARRRYHDNRKRKCIHCNVPYCSVCNVTDHKYGIKHSFECRDCCIKREYDQIFDALSFVFKQKRIDKTRLINIITNFSVGIVVECGNFISCSKEINIKNQYDFDGYIDYKGHKISHYAINDIHKLRDNLLYNFVYGKYCRIFCTRCSIDVIKRCQHTNCNTRDIFVNNKTEIGKEMYIICGDHLFCQSCDFVPISDYVLVKCRKCRRMYCDKCHLQRICRNCLEKDEIKYFADTLYQSIGNILYGSLTLIIAQYSIGKCMNCCNLNRCMNAICIRNQCDFMAKKDANNKEIYWYRAKQRCKQNAVSLYGELIIIFCSDCTKNTLNECCYKKYHYSAKGKCRNKEASNNVCQLHPRCCLCGTAMVSRYSRHEMLKCKDNNCSNYQCNECRRTTYCLTCIISRDTRSLLNTIKMYCEWYEVDDIDGDICRTILSYSKGYIVSCCNNFDDCTNEICINNEYEFENFINFENKKIYHYAPLSPHNTVYLYGKQRRIFCSFCTQYKLKEYCQYCGYKDATYPFGYCPNHKICTVCGGIMGSFHDVGKCKKCGEECCKRCMFRSLCCDCIESKEQKRMIKTLKDCIPDMIDMKIFEIIASYSLGYIVYCCNPQCEQVIVINNRLQCLLQKDVYQYIATKRVSKVLKTVYLYGKRRRIFCGYCSHNHLMRCQYRNKNKRCNIREMEFDNCFEFINVCNVHHYEYKGHCFRCDRKILNWNNKVYPFCTFCRTYSDEIDFDDVSNSDGTIDNDGYDEKKRYRSNICLNLGNGLQKYQNNLLFQKHYFAKNCVSKYQKPPKRCTNRKKKRSYFKNKTDKVQNTLSKQQFNRKYLLQLQY